mmetsp:Transcript_4385/g.6573  ORF Transcript_4385/g.6573 Transcript_4385/m.6573 type:complete len:171 (-) Transcript_4385:6-518(-)
MARGGLKKALKASKTRLFLYLAITIILKIACLGYQFSKTPSVAELNFVPSAVWLFSQLLCLAILWQVSKARYDKDGLLAHCVDITDSAELGVYSYVIDCIVLLWIVETGSLFSRKVYVLLGIAPMAAVLKFIAGLVPSTPQLPSGTVTAVSNAQAKKNTEKKRTRFAQRG